MADVRMKRMLRERVNLEKESTSYVAFFTDDDLCNFFVYVIAPEDSVYCHKLVKLQIEIPPKYPLVPPKVKFIQHVGMRIHPNLYVEGKVCLSILGTWPGEPWATSMTVDAVLRTVQSLLDNKPYLHEPGCRDNPVYNDFVRYTTWSWLLLDYVERETHPKAKVWLQKYVSENSEKMIAELARQQATLGKRKEYPCQVYMRGKATADYPRVIRGIKNVAARTQSVPAVAASAPLSSAQTISGMLSSAANSVYTTLGLTIQQQGATPPMPASVDNSQKRKRPPMESIQSTDVTLNSMYGLPNIAHVPNLQVTQNVGKGVEQSSERPSKRSKDCGDVVDLTSD